MSVWIGRVQSVIVRIPTGGIKYNLVNMKRYGNETMGPKEELMTGTHMDGTKREKGCMSKAVASLQTGTAGKGESGK